MEEVHLPHFNRWKGKDDSLGFKFSKRKKLFYYNTVSPSLSSPQPPTDGLLINVNRAEHSIQQVSCFVLILFAFLFKTNEDSKERREN